MNPKIPSIEVVYDKPPADLWRRITEKFDVEWPQVVVTYDGKVYAGGPLSDDLIVHEAVHIEQQKGFYGGADNWWDHYINEPDFRFKMEVEAYAKQYKFLRNTVRDRNKLAWHLNRITRDLSGPTYGNMIGYNEAKMAICA